jgi:hypothetical protein
MRSVATAWLRRLRHGGMHPPAASFSRYIDHDLPVADREALECHVRECISCRRMLGSLSETVRALGTLCVRDPPGRAERIIAGLAPRLTGDGDGRGRSRLRAAVAYCLRRSQLRYTVPIGLFVGVALSLANKGAMLMEGRIDFAMCVVCALDFLLPFVAMNVLLLWVTKLARRS